MTLIPRDEVLEVIDAFWRASPYHDRDDVGARIAKSHSMETRRIVATTSDAMAGVTRVAIIGPSGLVFEKWNVRASLSLQDDGRTLKVFIREHDKQ